MKKILFAIAAVVFTTSAIAQKDETAKNSDTIKVGNFVIIKKKGAKGSSNSTVTVGNEKETIVKKKKNQSTNWWILDLGFANLRDETNYASAQAGSYLRKFGTQPAVDKNSMKLNTGKTSNVNIWFFMQKLNITNHVLNLKYGLGVEMYNFRYDGNISYRKNGSNFYVFNDSANFSKNKLMAGYLTMPLMLNVNTTPNKKKGFSFSAGVSAGYLIKSRNKQISDERGKIRYNGNFDLEPFRLAAIGEIGIGGVRLYGSYSFNALHEKGTMLQQYPYAVGIRLSSF